MTRLKHLPWLFGILLILTVSCEKEQDFKIEPPIPGYEKSFTELNIDPQKDSVYILENGTRINIRKASMLDATGNPISEPLTLKFRQFDDAVSIFLAGLPMSYTAVSDNMALETAGMFEIRGEFNGQSVRVDPEKPISVSIGSFFTDTQQGFFKLNETTGDWSLIDIPEMKFNPEAEILRKKLKTLKPKWEIPLEPNHYVFSLERMADIFLGNDRAKIYKTNMDVMKKKMKGYGVKQLDVNIDYNTVKYKGNTYEASEMLWKTEKKVFVPNWVKKTWASYYDSQQRKYIEQVKLQKKNKNIYKLTVYDAKNNKKWSVNIELITHLRYLVRYSAKQLIAKQKEIEREIEETEKRLKKMRLIEYTADIYSMGIFNCDRPVYFQTGKPHLKLELNGELIAQENIHKVSVFNEDLSSYANPVSFNPLVCTFFKGINKIVVITKNGDIGLFTGEQFQQINPESIRTSQILEIKLQPIEPEDEEALRVLLKK